MSGPASKLFPPDFFPESNSFDSKHSPAKHSIGGETANAGMEHLTINQNEVAESVNSNPIKLNEVFSSQLSASTKNKMTALRDLCEKKLLNVTLSPQRIDLEVNRNHSYDHRQLNPTGLPKQGSLHPFIKEER
mmetsp:Transcript_37198/g.48955  ORF Transcript_37198/g.48955 Transcript_37198/m.48955 type:complete len:133 (-) Transcript_37198:1461-1859(-)